MSRKDWFPFLFPLLFLLVCLIVELCLRKWNAVLAIGIVSGLYLVIGVPLLLFFLFLTGKVGGEKQKRDETPPDPKSFVGFWSGEWIKSRGKKGLIFRVLFALIPFVLFFGFAAREFFSGAEKDAESTLLFLAWVAVGLGGIAAMIIRDTKKRSAEKNDEKTAASGDLPGPDRREQWDEWLKNGLIDKEEYRALRARAEQKDAGKPR
jgi:hypothetical protein